MLGPAQCACFRYIHATRLSASVWVIHVVLLCTLLCGPHVTWFTDAPQDCVYTEAVGHVCPCPTSALAHFGWCLQIYKETCKAITYDCTTDILSASCATDATLSTFTNTSLEDASHCFSGFGYLYGRIIANVGGVLDCQLSPSAIAEAPNAQLLVEAQMEAEPEPEAEGPAADGEPEPEPEPEVEGEYEPEPEPEDLCGLVYNYYSKYDATGMDAPDGVSLTYPCSSAHPKPCNSCHLFLVNAVLSAGTLLTLSGCPMLVHLP